MVCQALVPYWRGGHCSNSTRYWLVSLIHNRSGRAQHFGQPCLALPKAKQQTLLKILSGNLALTTSIFPLGPEPRALAHARQALELGNEALKGELVPPLSK
jgi:hypothetical protein